VTRLSAFATLGGAAKATR